MRWLMFLVLLVASPLAAQDTIAFPGAVGFGAFAKGGSVGDSICHVSLLTDTDWQNPVEGELRFCTDQDSVTIVFDTAGTITLDSILQINNHTTILGQTAQGGIQIVFAWTGVQVRGDTSVIISHIKTFQPTNLGITNQDNFAIHRDGLNIYIDHISARGSRDEAFAIVTTANTTLQNITVDQSLFGAVPDDRHLCFMMNYSAAAGEYLSHVSVIESACLFGGNRSPVLGADTMELVNFYSYMHSSRAATTSGNDNEVAIIASYWKAGSYSSNPDRIIRWSGDDVGDSALLYLERNAADTLSSAGAAETVGVDTTQSFWLVCEKQSDSSDCGADSTKLRLAANPVSPTLSRTRLTAYAMRDRVEDTRDIGRSRYMSCSGQWISDDDQLDSLLFERASDRGNALGFNGGAFPDSTDNYLDRYGFATPPTQTVADSMCTDSDSDGLPDAWEQLFFSDLDETPNGDPDNDKFENLTEYAFGFDPTDSTSLDGTESGAGGGGGGTTYGNNRNIYLGLLTKHDTLVSGTDTTFFRTIHPDSVPALDTINYYIVYNDSTFLLVTDDTITGGIVLQDSATVDSICTAWGRCSTAGVRSSTIP